MSLFFPPLFIILRGFLEKLENTTTIPEILWILRHEEDDKRITWKQNPHFYSRLPKEASYFGRNFHHEPLKDDDFREALVSHSNPIYILSDKPCRLHLDDTTNPRVFGNVWQPHHTFILKGEWAFQSVSYGLIRKLFKIFVAFWIQQTMSLPPMDLISFTDMRLSRPRVHLTHFILMSSAKSGKGPLGIGSEFSEQHLFVKI